MQYSSMLVRSLMFLYEASRLVRLIVSDMFRVEGVLPVAVQTAASSPGSGKVADVDAKAGLAFGEKQRRATGVRINKNASKAKISLRKFHPPRIPISSHRIVR